MGWTPPLLRFRPAAHICTNYIRSATIISSAHSPPLTFRQYSSSPYAHGWKEYVPHPRQIRLQDTVDAQQFVEALNPSDRRFIYKALIEYNKTNGRELGAGNGSIEPETEDVAADSSEITRGQVRAVFLYACIPFVGFGFLDNLLMIVAGEYIDNTLGVMFGISTMAAAGLGNIISDLCGIGLAHYIESVAAKFSFANPVLTAQQWELPRVRMMSNLGRAIGLTIGCFIGMFPLLFFDESEKLELKHQLKRTEDEKE